MFVKGAASLISKTELNPLKQFRRVLVANRGAVAVRVIRACKALGLETVAVFTEADREWLPRFEADQAVCIGSGNSTDSYLSKDTIINAAKRTSADALHPGYGFFAENADFARACEEEGIIFIGAKPDTINLMADKAQAKVFVDKLGVPIIPGIEIHNSDRVEAGAILSEIDLPIMVKAIAGGGGMGIRKVEHAAELDKALDAVRLEATSSFGDERLMVEKFFPKVRHIEVQILADQYGSVIHAFDRECSVQRRRQKLIEEAPASNVPKEIRKEMLQAAVKISKAANYQGLGTIEFILVPSIDGSKAEFFFLEMNTRLQVEHGVTEEITGIDLVKEQIEVAMGAPLSIDQSEVKQNGYAIQARVCAENSRSSFIPSTGQLLSWELPTQALRCDTGAIAGINISSHYDSLLAKAISHAPTRLEAMRKLHREIGNCVIHGVETNCELLRAVLRTREFFDCDLDTRFVDTHLEALNTDWISKGERHASLIASISLAMDETQLRDTHMVKPFRRKYDLRSSSSVFEIQVNYLGQNDWILETETKAIGARSEFVGGECRIAIDGIERKHITTISDEEIWVSGQGLGSWRFDLATDNPCAGSTKTKNNYHAEMAGRVVQVFTKEGESVAAGTRLVVLESMKMELEVVAKVAGTVGSVLVKPNDLVEQGSLLLTLEDDPSEVTE